MLVELIDGQPVPKVIDFGLAKAMGQKLTDKTLYSESGQRIGTLEYMSPEQAVGDASSRHRHRASDIYLRSGVLLYELLTGNPPFSRRELEKIGEVEMRRVIREVEPPKPSARLSSSDLLPAIAANRHLEPARLTKLVRGELDWIVMKALEKERDRRYGAATAFAQDVERYLNNEPVQAAKPSAIYRARKFLRRNKAASAIAATVLVAAIAGTYAAIASESARVARRTADQETELRQEADVQRKRAEQDRAIAETARETTEKLRIRAEELRGRAETAEARTRRLMYGTQIGAAERAMREGNENRFLARLEETSPQPGAEEDFRDFEWYHLRQLVRRPLAVFKGHVERVTAVAYGSGGAWLASGGMDGQVGLWDSTGRKPVRFLKVNDGGVTGISVSPDGKWLATGGFDQEVVVWDVVTGKKAITLAFPCGEASALSVAFSPDGKQLAAAGGRAVGRVETWVVETWREGSVFELPTRFGGGLAFAPDGRAIAVGGPTSPRTRVIWDIKERRTTATLEAGQSGPITAIAFAPLGGRIATASSDGTVQLWDVATGQSERVLKGHDSAVLAVCFRPDGKSARVGRAADEKIRLWDAARRNPASCTSGP